MSCLRFSDILERSLLFFSSSKMDYQIGQERWLLLQASEWWGKGYEQHIAIKEDKIGELFLVLQSSCCTLCENTEV